MPPEAKRSDFSERKTGRTVLRSANCSKMVAPWDYIESVRFIRSNNCLITQKEK